LAAKLFLVVRVISIAKKVMGTTLQQQQQRLRIKMRLEKELTTLNKFSEIYMKLCN
jgi:hypothetical protein